VQDEIGRLFQMIEDVMKKKLIVVRVIN